MRAPKLNDELISYPPPRVARLRNAHSPTSSFSLNISRLKLAGWITSACDARREAAAGGFEAGLAPEAELLLFHHSFQYNYAGCNIGTNAHLIVYKCLFCRVRGTFVACAS